MFSCESHRNGKFLKRAIRGVTNSADSAVAQGPESNAFLGSDFAFQTPSGFSFICYRLMYWSADMFRLGVRCDRSDSLAILCETYGVYNFNRMFYKAQII